MERRVTMWSKIEMQGLGIGYRSLVTMTHFFISTQIKNYCCAKLLQQQSLVASESKDFFPFLLGEF